MQRSWPRVIVVVLLAATTLAAGRGAVGQRVLAEPIDPARVLATIDRAVGYLKRTQNGRGAWNDPAAFPGGTTALCTLALLNAGLGVEDPTVAKGLKYLRGVEPSRTYCVALQTMAFCEGAPRRDFALIQRNVRWLEGAQRADEDQGAWGYGAERASTDPSNSQFALLALYDAQRVGAKVDPETWRRAAAYWRKLQNNDGSWSYNTSIPGTGSMTCAGVGALVVAGLAEAEGDARVAGGRVECCLPHDDDEAIERGLAWLGEHFSVRGNPAPRGIDNSWHYYYLYGLERAGRLSARRFLGAHDWYREGTERLVVTQDRLSHTWQGDGIEADAQIASSFALLFLSKGRRPILLGKLRHGPEVAPRAVAGAKGDSPKWNAHRRDAWRLTEAAEKAWELPMTWQTLDPRAATVEDLLQAPVLYVSGLEAGGLLDVADKLRDYVDRGGFVFAEPSCCDPQGTRAAIDRLVEAMFPEPEHRLRTIEPSHPLWRTERVVRPESDYVGSLVGVEYGCRTSFVYCEEDLSCYWELGAPERLDSYPAGVRDRVEDAASIGLNVLAYATNREPRGKEQQFVQRIDDVAFAGAGARGVIEVAKLRHGGGCDDAPGALGNLLRAAAEGETKLAVSLEPRELSPADPGLRRRHFAFMHGRRDFRFTPEERRALGEYLKNGGTLLIDSICASEEFAAAARREVAEALGAKQFERVPTDDPLLTADYGGFDVRTVELRDPQPTATDEPLAARVRRTAPLLEGIKVAGRWAVILSPYDLSCALERHEAIECRGYRKEDAARIGLNVLLYSINQ
ncbi:MAG: DUF4159 domain-containing protein [Lacipirellulaceae bacterium]